MAKILSGGYDFEKSFLPNKQETAATNQTDSMQEQIPETWGEYGLRNIAKIPALTYETARSGLGIGNLLQMLTRNIPEAPQETGMLPLPGGFGPEKGALEGLRRGLLPTSQEAGAELKSWGVPAYYREHRPEDILPEFALTELPFLAAGGAFKSLPKLAGGVGQSLAMLGGATAGGAAGEALGEAVGAPEIGGAVGGLLGGFGGQKALSHIVKRPSKILPEKVYEKEAGLFETEKESRLKSATGLLQEKLGTIGEEYNPEIAAAQKAVRKAELAIPKDKVVFEKTKKKQINDIKKEITDYNKAKTALKEKAGEGYREAEKLERGKKGETATLKKQVNKIKDKLVGVNAEDEADILRSVTQVMEEGKTMTLERAKEMHKNFNAQIFAPRTNIPGNIPKESGTFQRYMRDINQEVGNFIKEIGGEEHYKQWVPAEEAHSQYSKMIGRTEKDFIKAKTDEIKEIKQEKYSPEREAMLRQEKRTAAEQLKTVQKNYSDALVMTQKEHKGLVEAIGKETYEDVLKSRDKASKLTELMAESLGAKGPSAVNKWGLAGAFSVLGGIFGHMGGHSIMGASLAGLLAKTGQSLYNEIKIAREVMKTHPELYKEYTDIVKQFETLPKATILKNLAIAGNKIERAQQEEPAKGKQLGRGRIIAGGMI